MGNSRASLSCIPISPFLFPDVVSQITFPEVNFPRSISIPLAYIPALEFSLHIREIPSYSVERRQRPSPSPLSQTFLQLGTTWVPSSITNDYMLDGDSAHGNKERLEVHRLHLGRMALSHTASRSSRETVTVTSSRVSVVLCPVVICGTWCWWAYQNLVYWVF